ncbi:MAG TPA: hypothetical protein VH257_06130 [Chloroflexota bacterium]|nr:hypothetical protein [Chloroflexota bacterium]
MLATLGALTLGAAGCVPPWAPAAPAAGKGAPSSGARPAARPPRRLRLVLSPEGLPALDEALRRAIAGAAGAIGATAEVQEMAPFLGGPPAVGVEPAEAIAHRLLVAVQAGTPPDALLLLGREAQVARLQSQGLLLDVSGLMRRVGRRQGEPLAVSETLHVVAGKWFAVPWYQRLVGHWVREPVLHAGGLRGDGEVTYAALRQALAGAEGASVAPWGIGGADTADVDAWCWGAIHAWGGGLADRKGERVNLDTPQTVGALEWLAETLSMTSSIHPAAGGWGDGEKNRAFERGETAYTYSERAIAQGPGGPPGGAGVDPAEAVSLRTLAGPVARPRAVGGGGAWLVPRGGAAEATERLLEALLDLALQRPLWVAGGRFALPAYLGGWDDPAITGAPWAEPARRFRAENDLDGDAFVSAAGNGGPETGAAQAIGALRFGAGMLRAVLAGRPAPDVVAETQRRAVQLYRTFGLPG